MTVTIGTYLPPWGKENSRVLGVDEDAITLGVAAGLQAIDGNQQSVTSVTFVSRDFEQLGSGSGAVVLAGLGLASNTPYREILGGSADTLVALSTAIDGALVIGSDISPSGAAAAFVTGKMPLVSNESRVFRSLPVATRSNTGRTTDYADPRLLRESGWVKSLAELKLPSKPAVVLGVSPKDASGFTGGRSVVVPTSGASAPIFAIAAIAQAGDVPTDPIVAIEQANAVAAWANALVVKEAKINRLEPVARAVNKGSLTPGSDIGISIAAYDRAFDAKVRFEAQECPKCKTLDYPRRFRCTGCGHENEFGTVALPRTATVYTQTTIHVPVPGLTTPYSLALVQLTGVDVRVLVKVTGAAPGAAAIGDKGTMVLRKVADRTGITDYGYAFWPDAARNEGGAA